MALASNQGLRLTMMTFPGLILQRQRRVQGFPMRILVSFSRDFNVIYCLPTSRSKCYLKILRFRGTNIKFAPGSLFIFKLRKFLLIIGLLYAVHFLQPVSAVSSRF